MSSASTFDRFGVVADRDGPDGDGVVGEEVPSVAESRDDFFAGYERAPQSALLALPAHHSVGLDAGSQGAETRAVN